MLRTRVACRATLGLLIPGVFLLAGLCLPAAAGAAPLVSVFPIAGSRVASPQTQIAFRGEPASRLGVILVSGSQSGPHTGTVKPDSDGDGGSFLPTTPFKPGEIVTVRTTLNIIGGSNGSFRFTIANPSGLYPPSHWPAASRPRDHLDVWHFHSRKDIFPDAVSIDKSGPTAPGYIFVASQYGPLQDGPEILDNNGNVVWFKSMTGDDSASDVRVQTYQGKPVLTWWQGYVTGGLGFGEDVINNSAYQVTNVIKAANGLKSDLHEFQITPQNTALITAYFPVRWNTSSIHGSSHQIVDDAVVQEIDIPTGLVLFQWDSLDHVPVSDSYSHIPQGGANSPFDYFHVNSIDVDHDNNLIISGRNTWAAYKVNRASAQTIWTLGGKHSSFKMMPGASFAFQHDVRVRSAHDWFITMFDDGAGPPAVHPSRGLKLFLDTKKMVAKSVGAEAHDPSLTAFFEGNYQQLSAGDDFLGWGQQPYFTEYNSHGQEVFDAHFKDYIASYRAYRFQWTGAPDTTPAVVGASHGSTTGIYVSWNGATQVSSWRVQGGSSPSSLHNVASSPKHGFETAITFGHQTYVRVQALDGSGHVLSTSGTVKVG
jgi:Arylsulfotransferase (ASST)